MVRTKRIERLIEDGFKSQAEFARQANMPLTTLRSILAKGIDTASVANAIKICNALNIPTEALDPIIEKAPEISLEGRYADFIELLDEMSNDQLMMVKGYMECVLQREEFEAVETAKQINTKRA